MCQLFITHITVLTPEELRGKMDPGPLLKPHYLPLYVHSVPLSAPTYWPVQALQRHMEIWPVGLKKIQHFRLK